MHRKRLTMRTRGREADTFPYSEAAFACDLRRAMPDHPFIEANISSSLS